MIDEHFTEPETRPQMKILLINAAFEFETSNDTSLRYLFPFGLGYIAAYLQQEGHDVAVWDIYAERIGYTEVLEKLESGYLDQFTHIGISGIVTQYLYIQRLITDIKQRSHATVLVGGPLSTHSHELVLNETGADGCVLGPGEETMLEIMQGKSFADINGLAYKDDNGAIIETSQRKLPKDLDQFPMPSYELFDMDFYVRHTGMMDVVMDDYTEFKIAPMITARGCPYSCSFCSKSVHGISLRSLDSIFDEIEFLQTNYGIEGVHFVDELLVISQDRVAEICTRLKKLDLFWDAQARINLVNREMLQEMKDSGCVCVGFGIESGSAEILEHMKKKITPKQIEDILTICRDIDLPIKVQLIYGYPGETDETLRQTVDLFRRVKYPARRFSVIKPLPGAPLYDDAKADGHIGMTFSEVEFITRLCNNWHAPEIQYNRTAFSDEVFWQKLREYEKEMLYNFLKDAARSPLDLMKHWATTRYYLRNILSANHDILPIWIYYVRAFFKKPWRIFPFLWKRIRPKNGT